MLKLEVFVWLTVNWLGKFVSFPVGKTAIRQANDDEILRNLRRLIYSEDLQVSLF